MYELKNSLRFWILKNILFLDSKKWYEFQVFRTFSIAVSQKRVFVIVTPRGFSFGLGKWFDASLKDDNNVNRLRQQVKDGMQTIDKTQLPCKYKAWMYQHGLLPRLIWPLTLYEIPTTAVEVLERSVSKHLMRLIGVPPSFTFFLLTYFIAPI